MNLEVDFERLLLAEKAVRAELLAERSPGGCWTGRIGSSPVATAAAVSALVVSHHEDCDDLLRNSSNDDGSQQIQQLVQGDLSELLLESVHWLARRQNEDGGWGDCDGAESNLAATILVQAAFRLTGIPAKYADLMMRADEYVTAQGGVAGLRKRSGVDKTYVAAILANAALADMVAWRQVPSLPFEWLSLPGGWRKVGASSAGSMSPTAVAVGIAKFHNDPTRNPITRLVRRSLRRKTLANLEKLQAADDSFEGSPLATAFIVMSLAGMGCQEHSIVERGIEFLLSNVRADASWALMTNSSTINTCAAYEGLFANRGYAELASEWHETATPDETVASAVPRVMPASPPDETRDLQTECLNWLLKTQHASPSNLTDAPAGGWGASDASSSEPNTIATSAALVALAQATPADEASQSRVGRAAYRGINWLLEMQNDDGGWPTFMRDDDSQPLAASGVDPTAQAIRALVTWQQQWKSSSRSTPGAAHNGRIDQAMARGFQFLETCQRDDGSFVPLWFGNEQQADDENPVIGTALVLAACESLRLSESNMATRAAGWLVAAQHSDGGWGPPRAPVDYSDTEREGPLRSWRENDTMAKFCSVEETSAALAALLPLAGMNPATERSISRGLQWLAAAVEQDAHRRPAVIGFYPGKIWYYDRLSPLAWAAGTLSRAVAAVATTRSATTPVG
jgi:squalene-hopene/tetraprenyl-beta-curcumene cyclase